jgi:5'-methylthioinosine phosphorylase
MSGKIGIIGGTGLYAMMDEFEQQGQEIFHTPYGEPSGPLVKGCFKDRDIVFLARHGFTHRLPPHRVNYRANIWMMKQAGVDRIIAVNAVGSLDDKCPPQAMVLPDQLIDYSYGREHTFFADDLDSVVHIDFTWPYSQSLRDTLIQAAREAKLELVERAVYGCTQGPRLETAAEIRRMRNDGCDIVGMTGMPEAALARELGLDYASLSIVANWAAGITSDELTMQQIEECLRGGMVAVNSLLTHAVALCD